MGNKSDENGSITVRTIEVKGESALVEWELEGRLHRAYVSKAKIINSSASATLLEKAIPYGVPWADMIDLSHITPQNIEESLHRAGIWTVDELLTLDRTLIKIAVNLISQPIFQVVGSLRQQQQGKGR